MDPNNANPRNDADAVQAEHVAPQSETAGHVAPQVEAVEFQGEHVAPQREEPV